ncbi:aminotransferase class V-fold PLP-dependent enzyme [Streptomyces olivaceoviridis]|uniref:aminotransferase class V-fold PLP-dependent enzyme n=1 Tax=Streptomyces olivaceoviridis TaxID=1921 RepID=UPI0036FB0A9B
MGRSQFGEPPGYLDFARFGSVSADVSDTLVRAARAVRNQGWEALTRFEARAADTARAGAALLGAAEHEIAFVSSTSHGLFAAAQALRGPGTVLVTRTDFPAAVYPWLRAAERGGLTVRMMDGPVTADVVLAHLDDDVRAVSVCAVDSVTGFRTPLAEIKELIGPRRVFVVDAVQALGAVDIAADAADVLVCGGQKWLRSGWGAALLLVRDRVADLLEPGLGGWSGVRDPLDGHDHPLPALPGAVAHTVTNPDGPAVDALGAGLDLVLGVGIGQIAGLITEVLASLLDAARGRRRNGRRDRERDRPAAAARGRSGRRAPDTDRGRPRHDPARRLDPALAAREHELAGGGPARRHIAGRPAQRRPGGLTRRRLRQRKPRVCEASSKTDGRPAGRFHTRTAEIFGSSESCPVGQV